MNPKTILLLVGILLLAASGAVSHSALADDGEKKVHLVRVETDGAHDGEAHTFVGLATAEGDHLRIDDLDELAVGQSTTYTTEGGVPVFVTRDGEDRYTFEVEGKTVELSTSHDAASGFDFDFVTDGTDGHAVVEVRKHVERHEEGDEVEESEEKTVIVHRLGDGAEWHGEIDGEGVLHQHGDGAMVVIEIDSGSGEELEDGTVREEKRVIVIRTDREEENEENDD